MKNRITTLNITLASSYWYPTMLAQEAGEISESKAAKLLGTNIEEYRRVKWQAVVVI